MKYITNKNVLYQRLKELNSEHFDSPLRRLEFVACVIAYVMLSIFMVTFSDDLKGIFTQVQGFLAVYLTFRYGFFGLKVTFLLVFFEIARLIILFGFTHNFSLVVGLTTKIVTILSVIIVAVLLNNQDLQKKRLQKLSITDELTGVYNQRYFHKNLEIELEDANKYNNPLGLIMFDIDNFKMYNDIYGHDCGDIILKATASLIRALLNENEVLCRLGGDEFAIILPGKNCEDIEKTAKYLQCEFESQKEHFFESYLHNRVTISMGLSEYPDMSSSKNELISQADMAMYHAKNSGKNKVHFYQDVLLQLRKTINSDHQQLIGIFKGLLSTISAKDKYTLGHCERVSSYAVMIGEAMNLDLKDIGILQYAGLLHDIGKIELPKSVLNKASQLTDEEYRSIREHPVYSANILEPLEDMDQLIDYVKHHHERFDGKGYPDGLCGSNISLGARILCVADSFDAMLSERPYSKRMDVDQAINELKEYSGTHFDPEIVKIFITTIKSRSITQLSHL